MELGCCPVGDVEFSVATRNEIPASSGAHQRMFFPQNRYLEQQIVSR